MNGKYEDSLKKLNRWLSYDGLSQEIYQELAAYSEALKSDGRDNEALEQVYERFYKELEFGTGGLRGILGAGTNRMNVYTVGRATQGMADYVNLHFGPGGDRRTGAQPSVAISYDSRNKSKEFAEESARILAANGIQVYLYKTLMPTPALSFAVRHYGCNAGIMITASHNPAKYNGFKAYNEEGCQMTLEQADEVLKLIQKLDLFEDVKKPGEGDDCLSHIQYISEEAVDAFVAAVKAESAGAPGCRDLKVVYTPLNGSGNLPVRRILKEIGVAHVTVVPEQELPDGNFPTCPYPNPEKKEALALGLALCNETKTADLLLATDPDCDRVGIAVKHDGEYRLMTGNQVGILLLDFLCLARSGKIGCKPARTMPEKPVAVKTIVSSKMTEAVAAHYGVELWDVLTGFKFIGEQIGFLEAKGEENRYIFGFEESYGYLSGPYVRDKDAVNASMLICEMAAYYKTKGKTLVDRMEELYSQFGYYKNDLLDFTFEGAAGMDKMASIMADFRANPPLGIIGKAVAKRIDYRNDETGLPKADVLSYVLEDGSSIMIRPSGTEPKLKIYLSAKGATARMSQAIIGAMREELPDYVNLGVEAASAIPRPARAFY